ncbi:MULTISPECIES: hypothetical protein [Phaeodactylibacter]|jgi:hypothetical protein|uniref:Uncharacterized protein n=1 Tax=Phaeodactylibacter xiamenensis TaxID=1524460 RepID=A0A098S2W1_9BACT|nr:MULTISPECIES: hypothetical protein [Phaeodactylibacter]KGE86153.1 hypothetical protein IX84_23790 [Phaeodactylibacter xiamenensis]MCI4649321.1 hypothetical protein [Phaeodactylibacter sp.]MCI5090644.1 hypothetical protein [Phaeodactylibacter sp.]MCR9052132.1 hypothetical protein [bacterium]
MMKSALFYSVFVIFFLPDQGLAFSGCPGSGAQISAVDTIPLSERFDEPLSGAVRQNEDRQPAFQQRANDRKVIPIETIETDTAYRNLQEIPEGYNGFKIEIMSTAMPLPPDHDLFFQHGNITLEELGEGEFSYLIGHFEEQAKAESFRAAFLEGRYPASKVVGYIEGQRQFKAVPKEE